MLRQRNFLFGLIAVIVLLAVGAVAPKWLVFLATMAASHGLAVLGVVVLTRGGGATFGQGLFFAVGAYAAALTTQHLHISDALVRVLMGGLVAGGLGALVSPLLARYRGIFFAMLTLALSMVVYGLLSKAGSLGGTDGFNLTRPTFFGVAPDGNNAEYLMYALAIVVAAVSSACVWVYFRSSSGLVSMAVRNNALRLEYLGASARRSLAQDFALCSALGGLGGALTGLALGHVDPQFAYWTTSGEFVFAAILGGYQSAVAVFIASFILEIVRSFSSLYFPNSWQLALGVFLLAVVLVRPGGIGSLWVGRLSRKQTKELLATQMETESPAP
jgi:ABC-type branched-subunit amino acid transport system permease subunit